MRRREFLLGTIPLCSGVAGCSEMFSRKERDIQFSFDNDSEHTVTMSLSISESSEEGAQIEEIHHISGGEQYKDEFVIAAGEATILVGISGEHIVGGEYEKTTRIENNISLSVGFDGESVSGELE